jgi:hypothetical protein
MLSCANQSNTLAMSIGPSHSTVIRGSLLMHFLGQSRVAVALRCFSIFRFHDSRLSAR